MLKSKASVVNTYFFLSYFTLVSGLFIHMTTTPTFNSLSNNQFLNVFGYIKPYLDVLFGVLFNPINRAFPSQVYDSGPIMSEYLFYGILLLLTLIYIFFLDNGRKVLTSLLLKKFDFEYILEKIKLMSISLLVIFIVSFVTSAVQNSLSEGFNLSMIFYASTPEVYSPIVFAIFLQIIGLSLRNQMQLQKESDSII